MRAVIILGIALFSSHLVSSEVIEVKLPHEEVVAFEIKEDYTVRALKVDIERAFGFPHEFQIVFSKESLLGDDAYLIDVPLKKIWIEMAEEPFEINELVSKNTHSGYRNYHRPISKSEHNDMVFILGTLAKKSLVQLLKLKSKLNSAGDRIDHIHPLLFLSHIFSDEELKAYIHGVKKRGGFIWDEFFSGLKESLKDEMQIGNISDSMIYHFSGHLGIDSGVIIGPIHKHEWEHLVKLLILHLPREDDSDRYDM